MSYPIITVIATVNKHSDKACDTILVWERSNYVSDEKQLVPKHLKIALFIIFIP